MAQHNKTCIICKKEFIARRSDALSCSEVCRSQKNANARALIMVKPEIIAEARILFAEEQKAKYDSVIIPKEYKKLVKELADLRGKDKVWIDRKFRLYQQFVIDDCNHGYCEESAMDDVKEEIEVYRNIGK